MSNIRIDHLYLDAFFITITTSGEFFTLRRGESNSVHMVVHLVSCLKIYGELLDRRPS